jgi:hypothetical protein
MTTIDAITNGDAIIATQAIYTRIVDLKRQQGILLTELRALLKLIDTARSVGLEADWSAGETLIADEYYAEYIEDMNADLPEGEQSSIDPEDNYCVAVDFNGVRYWSTTGRAAFICVDCHADTLDLNEYYSVRTALWHQHGAGDSMLCIGCLETRLGRPLNRRDFTDAAINADPSRSPRLRAALTREAA